MGRKHRSSVVISLNSSRARNQIATKPPQRVGIPTVECPRGGDVRKYASAGERAAKNQNDRPPLWFNGYSIRTSVDDSHMVEAPHRNAVVWECRFYGAP